VGPEEARPSPEGLGEAEHPPGGSDEPGTSAVGPDWAVAAFTIILGGPRPMSFDLMGTVLSVPDKYYISVSKKSIRFFCFCEQFIYINERWKLYPTHYIEDPEEDKEYKLNLS
jgi:hypothetical protein